MKLQYLDISSNCLKQPQSKLTLVCLSVRTGVPVSSSILIYHWLYHLNTFSFSQRVTQPQNSPLPISLTISSELQCLVPQVELIQHYQHR